MGTSFWKMHGAGNDFILMDDRSRRFQEDPGQIASLCCRHTGIGADGLILIRPSEVADFRMRFFNPDGNEADMCGNGARCVARLAHDLGITGTGMTIETEAGTLEAAVLDEAIQLTLPPPSACRGDASLTLPSGESIDYDVVNTGVPHAIIISKDLDTCPVVEIGGAVRRHAAFAPEGTNVDFVEIRDTDSIRVRTYERGVEDETLACGTGITASAIAAVRYHGVQSPVACLAQSGDVLSVDFSITDSVVSDLRLTGPTVLVYRGELRDQHEQPEPSHA